MSYLSALFGRIFSHGTELEIEGGIDFIGGLSAEVNNSTGRIEVTGIEKPTSAISVGALAIAVDTDLDDLSDALGYSDEVRAVADVGLELSAVADPATPAAGVFRLRAKTVDDDVGTVAMVQSAKNDGRVVTSPEITEGNILCRRYSGAGDTVNNSSWVTLLTIPDVYNIANANFNVDIHVLCTTYATPAAAHVEAVSTGMPALALYQEHYQNMAWTTDFQVVVSGTSLLVQVVGQRAAPDTDSWIAWAEVHGAA